MAIDTIYSQMLIMVILIIIGYILAKKEIITDSGANQMTSIILFVFTPAIIIKAFLIPFSQTRLMEIALCFILSAVAIGVSIVIATLAFRKEKNLERFGIVFSNAGFMGIPLVQGILGSYQVFYLSIYMVVQNLYAWTYGIKLIDSSNRNFSPLKQLANPAVISFLVGMFLFIIQLPIPEPIYKTLDLLSNANTPMAMILIGTFLAKVDLVSLLKGKINYMVSVFRLLVVPAVIMLLLSFLPQSYTDIKYVILIASSTPVGALLAMFSQLYSKDVA
ncbi:AEC family transporter [Breznakia pachnodae]|uniref:Permease n=1 Tax=Breznakia pachnodae TaxID=265178 RepID=A0ABU0E8J3_9FIRM|nr:AEC family transporter [Breznakia pachnodae]MDQ0363051.1 putative permease [Breznakia pachnodae]